MDVAGRGCSSRKKAVRNEEEIQLMTSVNLPPVAAVRLVGSLIESILFERSQIPNAVMLLKKEHAGLCDASPHRLSRSQRERAAFLDHLQQIREALEVAFTSLCVKRVVLLLGATTVSAKEVFEIDVSGIELAATDSQMSDKDVDRVCSSALITLLTGNMSWSDGLRQRPRLMRGHVCVLADGEPRDDLPVWPARAFHIPRTAASVHFALRTRGSAAAPLCQESHPAAEQTLPDLLERVTLSDFPGGAKAAEPGSLENVETFLAPPLIWYQVPVILKGFR